MIKEWELVPGTESSDRLRHKRRFYAFCPACGGVVTVSEQKAKNKESAFCSDCSPLRPGERIIRNNSLILHKLQIYAFQMVYDGVLKNTSSHTAAVGMAVQMTSDEYIGKIMHYPQLRKYLEMLKGNALTRLVYGTKPLTIRSERLWAGQVADIDRLLKDIKRKSVA